MAATNTNTQNLSNLVINKVDSKQTFQQMVTNNLVNPNELYLIQSELENDNEIFPIEFILSPNLDNQVEPWSVTCDKTYTEITNAIQDGAIINATLNYQQLSIQTLWAITSNNTISFYTPVVSILGGEEYIEISYDSTNNLSVIWHSLATSNATLTIGSYTYDGSSAVNIPVYDGTYTWG